MDEQLRDEISDMIATRLDQRYDAERGMLGDRIRTWLRGELPRLLSYESSCDYGLEIHNAGRIIVTDYLDSEEGRRQIRQALEARPQEAGQFHDDHDDSMDIAGIPESNCTVTVRCSFHLRGVDSVAEPAEVHTLERVFNNAHQLGATIIETCEGHGIYRLTGLPLGWVNALVQGGSLDQWVPYSPSDDHEYGSKVHFESRLR